MSYVSVVIPVYNAEKYISTCLLSLRNQTVCDYEIVVVDDGSTDNTPSIVNSFAEKDKRIRIIKNNKKGVSSARNHGMLLARGMYITFVDADDQVAPIFIESLLTMIEENDCDCACVGYTFDLASISKKQSINGIQITEGSPIFGLLAERSNGAGGFVWNKIYKASLIKENHIIFDEKLSTGEDLCFNFNYFNLCQKVAYCNDSLYYYRLSRDSAVNRLSNPRWYELLKVYDYIMSSRSDEKNKRVFAYNYSLLILEAIYRYKFCNECPYTIKQLLVLKENYVHLSKDFTIAQNMKLLFNIALPNLAMKYRRRMIKE